MAEEHKNNRHEQEYKVGNEGGVESQDRGVFDFLGKKEDKKPQEEEVIATEFEKVKVSESDYQPHHVVQEEHKDEEEKKPSLLEKLHRSGSSSSSSSDEEEGEDEEKKKKRKEKKGLKEKIHEKISGEKEKEEDTSIPVEKYEEGHVVGEGCQGEEKKGFLDKIKEKLPGQHKKTEEVSQPQPQHDQYQSEYAPTVVVSHHESEGEAKEKKGFLDKIKEKLPGYHPSKNEEEKEKEKEKEKDSATHY